MSRLRQLLVPSIIGVVIFGLCASILLGLRHAYFRKYFPQMPFSKAGWSNSAFGTGTVSARQQMIQDLILNVLPGKSRSEMEGLLGKSPTHEEMRIYTQDDLKVRERNPDGSWKPFPRSGEGYYYQEFGWDSIYPLGYEQGWQNPLEPMPSRRTEMLMLRFDTNNVFSSWYVFGSRHWQQVVGGNGKHSYRRERVELEVPFPPVPTNSPRLRLSENPQ